MINVAVGSWVAAPSLMLACRVDLDQRTSWLTDDASGSGQFRPTRRCPRNDIAINIGSILAPCAWF
jgi:hypothetical protein